MCLAFLRSEYLLIVGTELLGEWGDSEVGGRSFFFFICVRVWLLVIGVVEVSANIVAKCAAISSLVSTVAVCVSCNLNEVIRISCEGHDLAYIAEMLGFLLVP